MSESEHMHYTVLDWALWAQQQGETGVDVLVAYLKTTWPAIKAVSQADGAQGHTDGLDHGGQGSWVRGGVLGGQVC